MVKQKFVDILITVMPIHNHLLLTDIKASLHSKINNFWEVLFCRGDMARIDIFPLPGCKIQFTGSNIVGMWTLHHNGHFKFFKKFQNPSSSMIWSSVHCENCVFSPIWPLFVELQNQLLKIDWKHLLIRIWLCQAEIDIANRVNCYIHGNSWRQLKCSYRVVGSWSLPLHSSKVTHS